MHKYLFLLGAAALVPGVAQAQERDREVEFCYPPGADGVQLLAGCAYENLIVVPGNLPDETGRGVTVLDREAIEQVQGADIVRVLERAPAVTFSRNGGPGSFTGVRVRGAEAEQLLVLVDGIRAADTASPGGGFDFGNLLAGNLDRIELLRGSNSTIWGSDAIAGVLAARSVGGDFTRMSAEVGSRESLYVTGSAGFDAGPYRAALYSGLARSEGFSSAATGTEADGFDQVTAGANASFDLTRNLSAIGSVRYSRGELEIDGFPAPDFTLADTDETQETRQVFARAGLVYDDDRLRIVPSYQVADTERANFDPAFGTDPTYTTDGTSERAELRGRWGATDAMTLHFGGELEWRRFSTLFDDEQRDDTRAAYIQAEYRASGFELAAGARVDDHSVFGSEVSFGGDLTYAIRRGVRLRASFGEGFKTPTLFQLFSDFGNRALQPERSRSYDAGIVFSDLGTIDLGLTAFRRDTENQIEFASCFGSSDPICADRPFGTYDNIGVARAQGIELEASYEPVEGLRLQGVYAYIDTENRTPGAANAGNVLARRPQHAATLVADYRLPFGLELGADWRIVSESFDDAANAVPLAGYDIVTLRAAMPLYEGVDLFGRVENVFDTDYQTAAGYNSAPRGVFVGIRGEL